MATRLPCALPRRPTVSSTFNPLSAHTSTAYQAPSHTPLSHTPSRAATLIKRPRRPYSFTQIVQLSDGSTYTMRTHSPIAMYKSTKDPRNHLLWNPNEKSLQGLEIDEAGKLAAFRSRFGRSWDAEVPSAEASATDEAAGAAARKHKKTAAPVATKTEQTHDALADLIAGYAVGMAELPAATKAKKEETSSKKKK
ncbi:hypothetical protein F5Y17DRAFT_30817 [Xylariaceae sp. FL0594]|nr:hypothetical protein F5Y17DRAFT_30817 [Xylariaceae sp. FL0594]